MMNSPVLFIKTTRFEPKAVMRGVQLQTASVKIGLRHREMAQMLLKQQDFGGQ